MPHVLATQTRVTLQQKYNEARGLPSKRKNRRFYGFGRILSAVRFAFV